MQQPVSAACNPLEAGPEAAVLQQVCLLLDAVCGFVANSVVS